jgi:ABC-type transport system substrate-binding protein
MRQNRKTGRYRAAAALLLASTPLAGCYGGGGGAASGSSGTNTTLNLAMPIAPATLDPGKFDQATEWYWDLAYDPLIFWGPDGKPAPGLATAWHYTGTGNRTFDVTLRSGVKFSDGSALTADAVKASIEYARAAGGGASARWADKTITVTGPLSIRITATSPDPLLPRELSQNFAGADIIGPAGLKNPGTLGTQTSGAGPYILQAKDTVPNDHYTYVPNPNYWQKSAVHYRKVVIRVIPNTNSVLNALKTGQVDAAPADYTTGSTAKGAGLQVAQTPLLFLGLNLLDRDGTIAPALRDVRVRQALNYAVDRKTITNALFGDAGRPTEQTVVPGQDGSLGQDTYTYDPAKAKQLLAAAGHARGLTIPVLTTTYNGQSQVAQAIASDLQKVGVTLKITTEANNDLYMKDMTARKYPVASIGFGCLPMYVEGPALYLARAATFNPFKVDDGRLASLFAQAAAASDTERARLDQQIEQRLVTQAWFVPVALTPKFFLAKPGISGLDVSTGQPLADPVRFQPGGGH